MQLSFKKSIGLAVLGVLLPLGLFAQNITVRGVVTDGTGETVIGASVAVKNTTHGTVTDVNGAYTLSVAPDAILEVACMGYQTQQVNVSGRTEINIVLSDNAQALDALVVIGYGSARRADVTGSIATMGGDNLREIAANDVSRSLAGRVAGVQMTQTSSRPGSSMEIRIRGTRSLSASNDPLIVLDGVPFPGSLSDISTNDIKNIDILKDASSTAIYGSRGANGVILITTYKGVSGQKPVVSFNNYIGFKKAIKYPMMTGAEYVTLRNLAGKFTNKEPFENDANDIDWQDLFYRTGVVRNHDLSVVGGTQMGSYRFGVSYFKDEAVVPTQDYDRISISGSLDQNITDWLKIGFTTSTNYNRNHGNQISLYSVLQNSPIASPFDASGNLLERISMPLDDIYVVTRETMDNLSDRWISERFGLGTYNSAYVDVKIPWVEGLSFKQTAGLNYRNNKSGSFTGVGVNNGSDANSPNSASISHSETSSWTLESLLTYDRTFSGKHHLNAVAMYSAERNTYVQDGLSAKNIPNEQFLYYNLGRADAGDITVNPNSSNYWQAGLLSWMGRVMYTFNDRYMLSAAVRSDASSRLAKGHQWHTYPAVSAGWNLHNENFMSGTRDWLDELKVRVGYGETSNQAISPYQTLGSLGTRPYNFGTAFATGYYVSTLPNDELGWEYSTTWNFGVDFGLWKGRLGGSIEYYTQKTHDILLSLGLPATSGVGSYTANIGSTSNRGVELSLNGTIIDKGDWRWDAGVNVYANRNTLVSLASGQEEDVANRWFVGMPINCIYDYEYDGLWQAGDKYMDILEPGAAPGDIKVKYHGEYDGDGAPVRAIDTNDRVPINADPILLGGFNTTLTYKNFDLTVLGNFQLGGVLISTLHGSSGYLNMLTGRRGQIKVDYWTESNTSARYPRPGGLVSNDNPKYGSTLSYFDGTFLKVGTITLGYNLGKVPLVRRAGIEKLRIYATAQNPFVLFSQFHRESGLDPEPNAYGNEFQASSGYLARQKVIGTNTPNTRNYLFGINLTF